MMLSTIHSRALAKAPSLSRTRRYSGASVSTIFSSRRDYGGGGVSSSRSTGATATATALPMSRGGGDSSPWNGEYRLLSRALPFSRPPPQRRPDAAMYYYSSLSCAGPMMRDHIMTYSDRPIKNATRSNFSYAGPRKLSDIIKIDLIRDKTSAEISDVWMTYHEGKEKVHGLIVNKAKGKSILSRAAQCPFFIHPVFREEGHFMIISQFQAPNYFLLALLEDYSMDPARAQPLMTVSVFDDMAEGKDVALVRCDIINHGIEDDEGYNICKYLLDDYANEEGFMGVHMFNKKPDAFDVDEFVKEKEQRWKAGSGGDDAEDGANEAESEKKSDNVV